MQRPRSLHVVDGRRPRGSAERRIASAARCGLDLRAEDEGYYTFDWAKSEPGLDYRCTLDGDSSSCQPGMALHLDPGEHTLAAYATDTSGNFSPVKTITVDVLDTELLGASEGA